MIKLIGLLALSVACAIFYRIGGASQADREKEFPWLPFKPWKSRDVWSNACVIASLYIVGISAPWWAVFLSFGLMWGALSTYWDFAFNDVDNHYAHGAGIGIALAPVMFFDEPLALAVRVIAVAACMGIYSGIVGNATWEELGRGFIMPITLGLVWLL